jgi:hypothetical protein
MSSSLKVMKDSKILEQIERKRTMRKRLSLSKVVEGEMEFYFYPTDDACNYILQNAFGGAVSSATVTGETVGGGGLDHTFEIGSMDQSYSSLCVNTRKGPSTGGRVWEYNGVRINELGLSAEIDDALKATASFICKDATQSSNDIETALTISSAQCLSFANGRLSVEGTFASLTSSSYWHIQNFGFKVANNLKNGSEARRIGTDVLDVLPIGKADFELTCTMRFDTVTAYDAMIAGTEFSAQMEFLGNTISGSVAKEGLRLDFPSVYIKEAGDPEIGGPDEVLTSEVVFDVLMDDSSAAGYAVKAVVTNGNATTWS